MFRLLTGAVLALGITEAANAWTSVSPVAGYRITASLVPAPHGNQALRLAVASNAGVAPAMKLHAYFIDQDGLILGEAPLGRPRSDGPLLVASDAGMRVPETATSLVVVGQPSDGGRQGITTQFAIPHED